MTSDKDMANNYLAALRDARAELAGLQERRRNLEATVAVLTKLVEDDAQLPLGADETLETRTGANRAIPVPSGLFANKTPTEAYRELQKLWPGDYTGAQVRDAFLAGGMKAKSKTKLLAQVHSVLRRERLKQEKAERNGDGTEG